MMDVEQRIQSIEASVALYTPPEMDKEQEAPTISGGGFDHQIKTGLPSSRGTIILEMKPNALMDDLAIGLMRNDGQVIPPADGLSGVGVVDTFSGSVNELDHFDLKTVRIYPEGTGWFYVAAALALEELFILKYDYEHINGSTLLSYTWQSAVTITGRKMCVTGRGYLTAHNVAVPTHGIRVFIRARDGVDKPAEIFRHIVHA